MSDKHNEQNKPKQSPGALLRQAREASGQTPNAIGEALHLTVHYIKSLENDEYSKLPGLTFVKGYVRAYARYLKLDVDAVLRCYDDYVGTLPTTSTYTTATNYSYSRKRNDQAIGWAIAATLVIVAGLGAGWWFVGRDAIGSATAKPTVPAAQLANQNTTSNTVTQPAPANTFTAPAFAGTTSTAAYAPANTTSFNLNAPTMPTADVVSAATTILPAATGENGVIIAVPTATDALQTDPAATTGVVADANASTAAVAAAVTVPLALAAESSQDGVPPTTALTSLADADLQSINNLTVIPAVDGGRQLNLLTPGNDEMQLSFSGNSWVEIDDGTNTRLFNEMLRAGDTLVVQGQAPFQVLLGDGRNVQVKFNSAAIDISSSVRTDSTARLNLTNPATTTVPVGASQ